jgi:glycosyltransferase involved in cell wall biosynthesis
LNTKLVSPIKQVSVLIPARDEEQLLPQCLISVKAALRALPPDVRGDLVVVVDNSTDRTWEIAAELVSDSGIVVRSTAGVVGKARALATQIALQRYSGPLASCWLANTDADCIVPANWLTAQLSLAASGIDVVAGTIDVVDFEGQTPNVEPGFRATYHISADGTHSHVHGANLGIRADAYLRAGGWSGLETGEDHHLWSRLLQTHARSASVALTQVITSGRRIARAPNGFAAALAAHSEFVA